jgi:flagellar basal body-associated protein FliL
LILTRQLKPRQQQLTTQIQHPLPRVMQRILETLWSQEKKAKVNIKRLRKGKQWQLKKEIGNKINNIQ